MQVKNKYCPFSNWHSGKIRKHNLQEQYHMVCVIRASKYSIQRRSITIWVFTYSMEYQNDHNYKWNSSHREWTRYIPIISSTIYLSQMQTAITRNSRNYLLAKTTWSNFNPNKISSWRVQSFLMLMGFIFPLIWILGVAFSIDEVNISFIGHHAYKKGWCKNQKVMYYIHMIFFRKDTHIKYLCGMILCEKNI